MLPGRIKLQKADGVISIVDPEQGELCRYDESSDVNEDDALDFFRALVKLWNEQF